MLCLEHYLDSTTTMTENSRHVLEPLWEDGEFVLSRSVRDGERSPLLVISPALAQPAPGSLRRLEHAYGLRDELDSAWAVRPLELVWSHGRPTLLLEDPGGELLARLVGRPWEVRQFLHVARHPRPLSERVPGIPAPIAAIVMKLLAKTAEERYQTAAGLTSDLLRCLADWEATGSIEPFPLGMQDTSDRLLIPERLYGREREIDAL